eukprot:13472334-Heterocapsa_arctica.AAC.1
MIMGHRLFPTIKVSVILTPNIDTASKSEIVVEAASTHRSHTEAQRRGRPTAPSRPPRRLTARKQPCWFLAGAAA